MKKTHLVLTLMISLFGMIACSTNQNTTQPHTTIDNTVITTSGNHNSELGNSHYQYSTFSNQNIKILHLDITSDVEVYDKNLNSIELDEVLVLNNQKYEIKSDYIIANEADVVEFYLVFNNQRTMVVVTKSDKEIPYIISSTLVVTNGSLDLSFQFELFGGNIKQISANGLTEDDYEIVGNMLVVSKEYVAEMLESEVEFIINYALETDQLVIGFISISSN